MDFKTISDAIPLPILIVLSAVLVFVFMFAIFWTISLFGKGRNKQKEMFAKVAARKGYSSDSQSVWIEKNGVRLTYYVRRKKRIGIHAIHRFVLRGTDEFMKFNISREHGEMKVEAKERIDELKSLVASDKDLQYFHEYGHFYAASNSAVFGILGSQKKIGIVLWSEQPGMNILPTIIWNSDEINDETYAMKLAETIEHGFGLLEKLAQIAKK
ncbi:hypothetical protein KJ780_02045 [Candidatus Micrarchaeota archaeon]|nr:hypothetical protein [Candidatus Micrarchaeota archaeon]